MPDNATTNWPNPERPGVPMFPERNGEHKVNYNRRGVIALWFAEQRLWWVYDTDEYFHQTEAETVFTYYHGPILTPTQIAELLAGERERCAQATEKEKPTMDDALRSQCMNAAFHAISRAAANIRNLGDAS